MREDFTKASLADRTEAILRSDRHALRRAGREPEGPGILLVLLPDVGPVIDLMDAHIQMIADSVGLQYFRPAVADLNHVPQPLLNRTFLIVADLTGRNEHVITQVYQALAEGKRVLLAAQSEEDIPGDLATRLDSVVYGLESGHFDHLITEVLARANSTLNDRVVSG